VKKSCSENVGKRIKNTKEWMMDEVKLREKKVFVNGTSTLLKQQFAYRYFVCGYIMVQFFMFYNLQLREACMQHFLFK
jgi:hypothetical protein